MPGLRVHPEQLDQKLAVQSESGCTLNLRFSWERPVCWTRELAAGAESCRQHLEAQLPSLESKQIVRLLSHGQSPVKVSGLRGIYDSYNFLLLCCMYLDVVG